MIVEIATSRCGLELCLIRSVLAVRHHPDPFTENTCQIDYTAHCPTTGYRATMGTWTGQPSKEHDTHDAFARMNFRIWADTYAGPCALELI